MKKIIVAIILISCLLTTPIANVSADIHHDEEELKLSGTPISYGEEDNKIVLTFSFDSPVITEINRDGCIYAQVAIEELPVMGGVGVPLLPVRPMKLLLPQWTMIESISVTKGDAIVLGEGYNVELGAEPTEISMVSGEESIETVIGFDPTSLYPVVDFLNVGVFDFRGYSVLTLVVYPVRYLGSTGELSYFDEITVTIALVDVDFVNPLFRGLPGDDLVMREMVEDYSFSNTYVVVDPDDFFGSLATFGDSYEYVVVTSEDLKNAGGSYTFQDLVQYKKDNGVSAKIVTVEDIYDQYDGVDNPERIRNFIKDAYLNWGTEYVLLGGDADVIPVRDLWVADDPGSVKPHWALIPSDLYYGCLDGTFDSDGDGGWGEPNDGPNGEDVDLIAEVYIGRACVGNGSEVSNFVMKTLAYEQTPLDDPYLKKALMVGSHLGFGGVAEYGGNYLDEMIDGSDAHGYSTVGIPSEEYQIDTLYDRDWPGNNWHTNDLITRINAEVNIINHDGHGLRNGWKGSSIVKKMTIEDVLLLENTKYSFIYSQACFVGGFVEDPPQNPDCFAEYLTVKTDNGAFAAIMNAASGYGELNSTDGASQRFAREFFDAIFNEGVRNPKKTRLGVANQDSKEDNLWRINEPCMRWCYYELNLFGDPHVSLKPVPVSEHDIAVDSIELPQNINPDEDFDIVVTIVNQGLNDETDISGKISIFEVTDTVNPEEKLIYEYPWSIDYLVSDDEAIIGFTYSLPRGLYRIRAHVDPVPEEDIIFNNNLSLLVFIGDNTPPEKPTKPSGPTRVEVGKEYSYSTSTIDPEGDQVYYQWYWGHDVSYIQYYSNWIGPYDSGETVTMPNTWYYKHGYHVVQARAKDVYGAQSDWSDPLPITMSKNEQSNQQSSSSSSSQSQTISSIPQPHGKSDPLGSPISSGQSINN